jgi:hypothetical protein
VPICSTMPSCITTILSAMVMASIWSGDVNRRGSATDAIP